ncbi:MFS transporter [Nocardioides baekrokdamisoli]|uniref:MFS transporter n=1 Tax=Nocardioides baekrokdamisoli TaxID=1804624 RepID=A0A3G9J326_9ACTN|nr:MFS transporter [Nocardioides baekrokdamisoli]BBH17844.1 MFS transporter [Nocardioides baekrokdamisoli]
MGFATYADVLRIPIVRRILILGLVVRVPLWASEMAITLHVVTHLHGSYADAGLVAAVGGLALGISGPWRGRRLDQLGVRRAIAPSIIVLAATWSIAPWVGYWPLLVLNGLAGLFTVPAFSIIRTVLISAVREDQRATTLSIDSIATEITFMVGPVLGVLAATTLPTPLALFICAMTQLTGSMLIWWVNPPLRSEGSAPAERTNRLRLTWPILAVFAMSIAAIIILTGEDMSVVAAMRGWGRPEAIGWVLGLWGAGSAVGGLVYGGLRRRPSAATLLLLLGLSTALIAVADQQWSYIVLLTVSGAFCAPAMTAMTHALSQLVPSANRGEAMGWHGSAMMLGSAVGSPLIGVALDRGGWTAGVLLAGGVGTVIAVVGVIATARAAVPEDAEPELVSA